MLRSGQFCDYFHAVHGCRPFPWQGRLLEQVVNTCEWPHVLSLPTGAGKTAILDVSVFALACGALIPRRTVLVVDRRIVVDDAFKRATLIQAKIKEGDAPILNVVREALLALGGESALEVALLRGGMYREDSWVRHPAQPLLVCSTVDQVGSRLLHQGYGVSRYMRSIHAGLLGNDTLIVLDEAHTSEPFRQTLEWITKYRKVGKKLIDKPFAVVTMTATPRGGDSPFGLSQKDHEDAVLSARLKASKELTFVPAKKPKDTGLVEALVEQALILAKAGEKSILVVVNRVAVARQVAETLDKLRDKKGGAAIEEPLLLTGRSRPLEREALLKAHEARLFAGRNRETAKDAKALIVVATQCVEVGADLDMDGLVSEACPLDSLRQRLGRLDRLGKLGKSKAVLVAGQELAESSIEKPWEDIVYGQASAKAWHWLRGRTTEGTLEVGIDGWDAHLAVLGAEEKAAMETTCLDAPIIFPAYWDLWVQTSPEPAVIPEPAIFLHGPQRGEPEVQIIWRADLPKEKPETWLAIVSACQPVVGEALRVPLSQARSWLENKGKEALEGSDLEGESVAEVKPERDETHECRTPFLRWRGVDESAVGNSPRDLRPGDTIVVPATAGGCDEWGWAPATETGDVKDLADIARFKSKRSPVLRLHPSLTAQLPESLCLSMDQSDENKEAVDGLLEKALASVELETVADEAVREALHRLRHDPGLEIEPHPSGQGWIVSGSRRMEAGPEDMSSEDDTASSLGREVPLEQHLADVEKAANDFKLGLTKDLTEDIALAARLHDLGKADPRFQAWLWKGERLKALKEGLLAKSAHVPVSTQERDMARVKAGYPKGGRHELLSVRLMESCLQIKEQAHDWDLVLHLVASHHGRCRPFAPVVEDPAPRQVTLKMSGPDWECKAQSDNVVDGLGLEHVASGVAERFWRLVRRYGWWGLSYLEACLRLADHRASELEEKEARV